MTWPRRTANTVSAIVVAELAVNGEPADHLTSALRCKVVAAAFDCFGGAAVVSEYVCSSCRVCWQHRPFSAQRVENVPSWRAQRRRRNGEKLNMYLLPIYSM
jgi:translation initiation factor RLI1